MRKKELFRALLFFAHSCCVKIYSAEKLRYLLRYAIKVSIYDSVQHQTAV